MPISSQTVNPSTTPQWLLNVSHRQESFSRPNTWTDASGFFLSAVFAGFFKLTNRQDC